MERATGRTDVFSVTAARMSAFNAFFINLVALMEIDGTPGVAFKAGVEEAGRVFQRGTPGKGHLHDVLVCLTSADDSGVRPHRHPSPLPLLDHFSVALLDEISHLGKHLASPIAQLLESRIDQLRRSVSFFSCLRAALPLFHGCDHFFHGYSRSPVTRSNEGRGISLGPRCAKRSNR